MSNWIGAFLMLAISGILPPEMIHVGGQNCPAQVSCQPYPWSYRCVTNSDCRPNERCCATNTETVSTTMNPTTMATNGTASPASAAAAATTATTPVATTAAATAATTANAGAGRRRRVAVSNCCVQSVP